MRVAERLFSRNQWLSLLNDFADLVADKEYVKINYNDWRVLSKPVSANVALELCPGLSGVPNIFIQPGAHTPIMLKADDGSLGDFLFDNIFSKEEQAMAYGYDSNTAVSAVSALEVKADYMDYDGTYVSNKYDNSATTNTVTIAGDSISTSKSYQLSIDGYGTAHVYDGTTWNNIGIADRADELESKIDQRPTFNDVNKMIDDKMKKGNEEMKGFNFDFGPCTGDQVRMSMYGLAVKNAAGTYVSYNPKTKEIVDVDILNFDGAKYMYKIPVALKDIALGDIIIHNRKPMFVVALSADGTNTLTCVDVCAGEQKTVIPTVNMFGFNFVTKIVSLFNTLGDNAPTPEAPFGNMLPLMLMDGNDEKVDPMMLMCMMQGNANMTCNPMMLYLMAQNNEDIDPMKWMVLSMMTNSAPAFMTGNYPKQQA